MRARDEPVKRAAPRVASKTSDLLIALMRASGTSTPRGLAKRGLWPDGHNSLAVWHKRVYDI
jgi:hypothetical protein